MSLWTVIRQDSCTGRHVDDQGRFSLHRSLNGKGNFTLLTQTLALMTCVSQEIIINCQKHNLRFSCEESICVINC